MAADSTTRFSDRVDNYIKYRPHYPEEVIIYLKENKIIDENTITADIGSGTGISTELFLPHVKKIYAVEPNKEMREAAEKLLSHHNNFISINSTAEKTGLEANSIDTIIAAQAFHWFNNEETKNEFKRILKSNGHVILMWNVRKLGGTLFLEDYETFLLKYGTDYIKVRHENVGNEDKTKFYGSSNFITKIFSNEQVFDFDGLKGRLLSSSYIPGKEHPKYNEMLDDLKIIFDKHQQSGKIVILYDTELYIGRLK
jgi:ubiquinone/menaquinone biosynthesis C-methylase UbiE